MENINLHRKRAKEEESNKGTANQPECNKMALVTPYLYIIILNVNRLNSPAKRQTVAEWIIKQDPTICCLQEFYFRFEDTQAQSEGMGKGIPCK